MREQRRLAAIVSADVAGYSRLMGRDESGTLAALKALRREVVDPRIATHGGRIVKTTGDGLLLEFPSVVDAVRCVVEVQTEMAAKAGDVPDDRRIAFRIGLHVGDIIIDGDDIFGDGVNIAARLEALAPPGGYCLSDDAWRQVRGKIDLPLQNTGAQSLKNIAQSIEVWRGLPAGPPVPSAAPPLALPDKPSIAVLPFQNMSVDPEQEYLADGMVEDILTALSRTKRIFVIARNSSFAYKGKSPDVRRVGRELGVRYVLEGSVRRAASQLRITGQLIEAETGTHLWADRFDGDMKDVFQLQDQVTANVVASILPNLERAEIERSERKPTDNLEAYDYFLRGRASAYRFNFESNNEALDYFSKAIALAPSFALAYARAAACYTDRRSWGWTLSEGESREAERLARKAVDLDPADPGVLSAAGWTIAYLGRHIDEGQALIQQSLEQDPYSFVGWNVLGWTRLFKGDPEALECFQRAVRLNPLHPILFGVQNGIAAAYHLKGDHRQALDWSSKVLAVQPKLLLALCVKVSSLVHLGRLSEAHATCDVLRTIQPPVYLSNLTDYFTVERKEILDSLREGLRLAGLPASVPEAIQLALPDKPSIAVLPFQNMSGDPEQEYFADGIVEDIITALSRNRGLFVIARNSSFTYKGRAVDVRQVGHDLGVRYVLEGSVRKAASRLRITAQLIEAETGAHLWADRFDGALEDVFELQDGITEKVIAALTPSVEQAEIDRAIRKTTNLKAYDFYLKAMAAMDRMTPKDLDHALGFAEQCLALDPTYARGHALLAAIYSSRIVISSSNDLAGDAAAAERSARKAFEMDGNDATILMQYGQVLWQSLGRREEGVALLDRAIALDPNLAPAWALRGMGKGGLGKTVEAVADLEQALRLSPRDPRRWIAQHALAWTHLVADRYDEALAWAELVLQLQPNLGFTLRVVIAAHAQAGRLEKAQEALATHMSIEPDARISTLRASYLRRVTPQAFEILVDGLRKAGFPE
jgi:TolB-like protein/class 3 adenylate cyclase/Tfp pilus assembly protein PilF